MFILLLGMLITCVVTAFLAFLLLILTFSKEILQHSSIAQHQGQAFIGDAQILQVSASIKLYKKCSF